MITSKFELRVRLFLLVIPMTLLGCALPAPSFSDMSQSYQTEMETFQNNNILINIVRASKNMPLSFLDIPNVVGSGTFSASVGASANLYGSGTSAGAFFSPATTTAMGSYSYWSPTTTLSVNSTFNFSLSSLQNEQFVRGLISPVSVDTVNYMTGGLHVPPELLYTLLIDRIEYLNSAGEKVAPVNNPLSSKKSFAEFQTQLRSLIDAGLSTEIMPFEVPTSPVISQAELMEGKNFVELIKLRQQQMMLKQINDKGATKFQLVQVLPMARFCFKSDFAANPAYDNFSKSLQCADPLKPPPSAANNQKDNAGTVGNKAPQIFTITLRSTQNVFAYLGAVLVAEKELNRVVMLKAAVKGKGSLNDVKEEIPFFVTRPDISKSKSIAKIEYSNEMYAVASEDNSYSVLVMNLLTQLINLLKVPGSIPVAPAVLIR